MDARTSLADWVRDYEPVFNRGQDSCSCDHGDMGFFNPEQAFAVAESFGVPADETFDHVWTIHHHDGEYVDDDCPWDIVPGVGLVNVVGYMVTRKTHECRRIMVAF